MLFVSDICAYAPVHGDPFPTLDNLYHEIIGTAGGDNYGEGNLDVKMITAFGLNVHTIVSNTNTSSSTEEGNGFGEVVRILSSPYLSIVLLLLCLSVFLNTRTHLHALDVSPLLF